LHAKIEVYYIDIVFLVTNLMMVVSLDAVL